MYRFRLNALLLGSMVATFAWAADEKPRLHAVPELDKNVKMGPARRGTRMTTAQIGKPANRVDGRAKVTREAIYAAGGDDVLSVTDVDKWL